MWCHFESLLCDDAISRAQMSNSLRRIRQARCSLGRRSIWSHSSKESSDCGDRSRRFQLEFIMIYL
jgi:hypothetical protein